MFIYNLGESPYDFKPLLLWAQMNTLSKHQIWKALESFVLIKFEI